MLHQMGEPHPYQLMQTPTSSVLFPPQRRVLAASPQHEASHSDSTPSVAHRTEFIRKLQQFLDPRSESYEDQYGHKQITKTDAKYENHDNAKHKQNTVNARSGCELKARQANTRK